MPRNLIFRNFEFCSLQFQREKGYFWLRIEWNYERDTTQLVKTRNT